MALIASAAGLFQIILRTLLCIKVRARNSYPREVPAWLCEEHHDDSNRRLSELSSSFLATVSLDIMIQLAWLSPYKFRSVAIIPPRVLSESRSTLFPHLE